MWVRNRTGRGRVREVFKGEMCMCIRDISPAGRDRAGVN